MARDDLQLLHTRRLEDLRADLANRGLSGFVVPHADEHQGEYLPASAERLAWLTGFTGSAGAAVVLAERAALFTDGRYTVQARRQTDEDAWELRHSVETPPSVWLAKTVETGARIGFDPWLHTPDGARRLHDACKGAGAEAIAVDGNPIDALWTERPATPETAVEVYPDTLAGRSSAEKRREVAAALIDNRCHAAFLSAPDSVCWLFNIRGADVPFTPFVRAFAVLRSDGRATLFVAPERLDDAARAHLGPEVDIVPPADMAAALTRLGGQGKRVLFDFAQSPEAARRVLVAAGAEVVRGDDPCQAPKARKTAVELKGVRAAHVRDGVALTRFLAWLDGEIAAGRPVAELDAEAKLEEMRGQAPEYRGPSFPAIVGSGPHGAIVHYRVDETSNRALQAGELFLVDSGGQYPDGTTDVTRTVAVGAPSHEMRRRFTQVLKGHIAIACARFPDGTQGSQLDTLARQALWHDGVDYDHGTGHGVGTYLSVHEGPQRIAKRGGDCALAVGMVISNEPGYYKEGAFGIRIENLVTVADVPDPPAGAEKTLLGFETLTLAPIDLTLVEPGLMTPAEHAWLNHYHQTVRDTLTPLLDDPTAAWLRHATRSV